MTDTPEKIILETIKAVPGVLPLLAPETLATIKAAADHGGAQGGTMADSTAVTKALDHISTIAEVPNDVWIAAVAAGVFAGKYASNALKTSALNAAYHDTITQALVNYFEGGSLAKSKNQFKRGMVEAFGAAWDAGNGGQTADADGLEWFNSRIEQELAHIDKLFQQAKELRKDKEFDFFSWSTERADGYARSVSDVQNNAKVRSLGNKMLTFDGEDGQPDNICQRNNGTCVRLKGQRHRASWWAARDLVPYRGNMNFDCGAWECAHFLRDDEGNRVTLE